MIRMSLRCCRVALAGVLLLALGVPMPSQAETPKAGPATIIVKIRGDAKLEIEGDETKSTGEERKFVSPELTPGKTYSYKLVAKWQPNNYETFTRTKEVKVTAGKTFQVDMTVKDVNRLDDIIIRYVPTPKEVVEAMCKLGKVTKDDIVFDLGSGDGRIVIMAVEKFNAKKGIGVDIDPKMVEQAKANAKLTKVEDRLEFRLGDVFKVPDLSTASVIMLYMSDDLQAQLAPILKKELKPGSRIVAHRFLLGDWKPDKTETIPMDGTDYKIHLWNVNKKD